MDDADLDWYDYGFRYYDPQIGRFPQLDPLAFEYPYYTPYQFAGCEPVANIDLDGLEKYKVLETVYVVHKARSLTAVAIQSIQNVIRVATEQARLGLIAARGAEDAMANAMSVGLYNRFGGFNLDDYTDPIDQLAYLNGQLKGSYGVQMLARTEIGAGGAGMLSTGWTGIGAAGSGFVMLHGVAVEATAIIDIGKTQELINNLRTEMVYMSAQNPKVTTDRDGLEDPEPEDKSRLGRKYDPEQRTVVESKDAAKVYDKMDKQMQTRVEEAIQKVRSGEAGGNQHVLGRDLKGYNAIDLKGTGKARGGVRIVYRETNKEIFIKDITDYH
ncbi:hypothetical protein J7I42_29230 [Niastella sp. MAH-29]|uniref:Bacterial toxin 50 domain-containing protein n=1 Tax=Niastella soli TaxID=2821487 RepID=A0ABS3Z2L0_9BACT|nr:hypothetical protein [Niastella soli]